MEELGWQKERTIWRAKRYFKYPILVPLILVYIHLLSRSDNDAIEQKL